MRRRTMTAGVMQTKTLEFPPTSTERAIEHTRERIVEINDAFFISRLAANADCLIKYAIITSDLLETFSGHRHGILGAVLSRLCVRPREDGPGIITLDYAVVTICGDGGDDTFVIAVSVTVSSVPSQKTDDRVKQVFRKRDGSYDSGESEPSLVSVPFVTSKVAP